MSLDRKTLTQFVEMAAESSEYPYPRKAKATPEVLKEAKKFEKDLERALKEWVKKNPLAPGFDESDLMDAEGAYLVLMTLRGEGVGIWDGDWDDYFNNPKEIKVLEQHLKRKVGKYADDSGTGSLNMAFDNAAYDTCGGEEMDEAYSAAPTTPVIKPTKLGPPNPNLLDLMPPDAGTSYSDDEEEGEECSCDEEMGEECACDKSKSSAMVRVVAELVKRGDEDLAEELLSMGALKDHDESYLDKELNKTFATLRAGIRKIANHFGGPKAKTAIAHMDKEVDVFQNKLFNKMSDILG